MRQTHREEIRVPGMPEPISHFTHVVRAGRTVFVSGQALEMSAGKVQLSGGLTRNVFVSTVGELTGFARVMRRKAARVEPRSIAASAIGKVRTGRARTDPASNRSISSSSDAVAETGTGRVCGVSARRAPIVITRSTR